MPYKGYEKFKTNDYSILLYKRLLPSYIIDYLYYPQKLFNYQIISFKNSKRTKAGCIELDKKLYFFKSYNNRGIIHTAKSIIRISRPFKVLDISIKLKNLDINTPTVLAAIEKRFLNMVLESYILTEFIDGYKPKIVLNRTNIDQYILYMSNFIAKIHNKNIFHGDLKANNLLIDKTDSSKIWLLDLDGVKIKNPISLKERIKDIARFIVSIDPVISEKSLLLFIDNYIKKANVPIENESFLKKLNLQTLKIRKRHEQKAKHKR